MKKACRVSWCWEPMSARGLCKMHHSYHHLGREDHTLTITAYEVEPKGPASLNKYHSRVLGITRGLKMPKPMKSQFHKVMDTKYKEYLENYVVD